MFSLQDHRQEICSVLSLSRKCPAKPFQKVIELGLFYIGSALPEVGGTHEKLILAVLSFTLYMLPIALLPLVPPACTKGQPKGREHLDSQFWDG